MRFVGRHPVSHWLYGSGDRMGVRVAGSGHVEVNGGRIFYRCDGNGPPIVLLHGGLMDHRTFDPQLVALSEDHTLVRTDLRGYGRSSVPSTDVYRHCDDVAAVVDALGFDRAVVGGSSFGGAVALDFAFAYPERVAGLILVEATPFAGWKWHGEFAGKAFFEAAQTGGIPAARVAMLTSDVMASVMEHPEVAAAVTEMVEDYSGWQMENRDPARWAENDAVGRLAEVSAPSLVVIGGRDVLDFRLMGEALAEGMPNATRHFWPDCGHLPHMEEPDAFNRLVVQFLNAL